MKIGFAITDPTGGGCHYRAHLPARVLRHFGHEVVVGETVRYGSDWRLGLELDRSADWGGGVIGVAGDPGSSVESFTDDAGATFEVFIPDVLVVTAGWALGVEEVLNLGRAAGGGAGGRNPTQTLVVDYDDGLEAPPDNAGWRPHQVELKLSSALAANRVTCSTPAVARDLRGVRRPKYVVRNMIDPALFEHASAVNRARLAVRIADEVSGELVCGYRGPLPWHLEDVRALAGGVGQLVELGCSFVHVGARDDDAVSFAEVCGIDEELVERRPHVPFAEYPALLEGVDLGLVPFARRPWSAYKSSIGALEWSAAGVPWVASDQPEYRRLSSVSLVAGPFGWGSRVRELLEPTARFDRWNAQNVAAARYDVNAALERGRDRGWELALGVAE